MNPLSGNVEVDEFVIDGQKPGKRGRGADGKTFVLAAVEKEEHRFGRIRLQVMPNFSGDILNQFVSINVTPGSTVATDGWKGYNFASANYIHRNTIASKTDDKSSVLPGVLRIASLVKRLMLGTFQGRFAPEHLQSYLHEYVFRFNRRTSRNICKKFMRIAQQATASTKSQLQINCRWYFAIMPAGELQ